MSFLSIVIPTRNRTEHFSLALKSLVDQKNNEIEIIVSDNSDENIALDNQKLVKLINDKRIMYFRPPKVMSMVEHWDWAVNKAKGEYVTLLTDRMVYKQDAINKLVKALKVEQPELLVFLHDKMTGINPPYRYIRTHFTDRMKRISSSSVINAARNGFVSRYWPRMLNSVCQRTVLNKIQEHYGEIFTGIAPDYSFCFRALDWLDEFVLYDSRLIISAGHTVSNGGNFYSNTNSNVYKDFISKYNDSLNNEQKNIYVNALTPWYEPVPYNIEMLEYLYAKHCQVGNKFLDINIEKFYARSLARVSQLEKSGVDVCGARKSLEEIRLKFDLNSMDYTDRQKHIYIIGIISKLKRFLRTVVNFTFGYEREFEGVMDAREYDYRHPLDNTFSDNMNKVMRLILGK